jgi:hypothetical protein
MEGRLSSVNLQGRTLQNFISSTWMAFQEGLRNNRRFEKNFLMPSKSDNVAFEITED